MRLPLLLALVLVCGCNMLPDELADQAYDPDGDGVPWPEDCDSESAERYPGATELWYDGVDQDCAGDDDFDQDADGFVPSEYEGMVTAGVEGSGGLPGGDCWDDPASTAPEQLVVSSDLADAQGQALSWTQPTASETHPQAEDLWYDGVDQDCDGSDDFDQDGDGWRSSSYPDQDGVFGEDCIDGAPLDDDNPADIEPDAVHPDAVEAWYDGTDQDCDGNDCDQDSDGLDADPDNGGHCDQLDCDDENPEVGSGDGFEEVWYDGVDQDCDGNDGDQDGDGYWVEDYESLVAAAGGEPLNVPVGAEGDCWDVPLAVEDAPDDFQASNDFEQPDASEVSPDATDSWYDGVDQDCAGDDDFDQDRDGVASDSWEQRDGSVGGDCDDEDPAISPEVLETWYDGVDQNCDGNDGDQDGDGYWADDYDGRVLAAGGKPLDVPKGFGGDCDDLDSATYPAAAEYCDGVDSDCDGEVDEDDALDVSTWYVDTDGDGYGDWSFSDTDCYQPKGWVSDATDCEDSDATINPAGTELCDGLDNDCDGATDHDDPDVADAMTWYPDADADGFGDASYPGDVYCDGSQPKDWTVDASDCDDGDAAQLPGGTELCNGEDDDCDGTTDEDEAVDVITWYADSDGDGWGDAATTDIDCEQPTGFVAVDMASDCDDGDASIYPGATEAVADAVDQDCDSGDLCYEDLDGDGYGTAVTVVSVDLDCAGSGEAVNDSDCDDGDASIHPGAAETVADGVDQDCDGSEDCYEDIDGDGYGSSATLASSDTDCGDIGEATNATDCDDADADTYPDAAEVVADGTDQDCDGGELCYEDADGDGFGSTVTVSSGDLACSDSGEASVDTDCDDSAASCYPGAVETVADGVDQDCDGGDSCYEDLDGDGYGSGTTVISPDLVCTDSGEALVDTDCDDTDLSAYPGAAETAADGVDQDCDGGDLCYEDLDGDTYGSSGTVSSVDLVCTDSGEALVDSDCDDSDAAQYPGAPESCNDEDDDCDGTVDGPGSVDASSWYADADGDGYGNASDSELACDAPSGFVADATDCDDADSSINPGVTEAVGDGVDQDCDGSETCYEDADLDGHGSTITLASTDEDCADAGESSSSDDCDDADASTNPGALEYCDGADDDCDGSVDEDDAEDATLWYLDGDADGYGSSASSLTQCYQPSGHVDSALGDDCDDADSSTNPGALEYCDGADDDCDGVVDEDDAEDAGSWCVDADGDGYGDDDDATVRCEQPSGYVSSCGDCDDADASVNPSATELCSNGLDDDCDGEAWGCTPLGDIDLSEADAILLGLSADDAAGCAVAAAGDVNGDGHADLLVGGQGTDDAGYNAGAAYLLLGPVTGGTSLDMAVAVLTGEAVGDVAGGAAYGPGDVDGDGYDDLLVGASANDSSGGNAGAAYLVLGPVSGDMGLGSAEARLLGEDSGDIAGSVLGGGDLSGDGLADLVVASPQQDRAGANAGCVYVQPGPLSGDHDLSSSTALLTGEAAGDTAGAVVATGDFDGDGVGDLLVGAPGFDDGATGDVGVVYLVLGPVTTSLGLASADARLIGEAAGDEAGAAVASGGDVDGDGVEDILVGAPSHDAGGLSDAGAAYLVLGPVAGDLSLATADAKIGGESDSQLLGEGVAGAGSIDGDGLDDVLLGAVGDAAGGGDAGAVFLFLGSFGGELAASEADATFIGEEASDGAGRSVAGAGDVNADGYDDIFVGAEDNDAGGSDAGAAYLLYGGGL